MTQTRACGAFLLSLRSRSGACARRAGRYFCQDEGGSLFILTANTSAGGFKQKVSVRQHRPCARGMR